MEENFEKSRSSIFKIFASSIIFLIVINLLFFYWFAPFKTVEFGTKSNNANFSLSIYEGGEMQFYPNMRYPNPRISYRIHGCPLQKKENLERAFEILSNVSILEFYPVVDNEEIYATCDSKTQIKDGLFIAGEGGPVNISESGKFNVIFNGQVLLIKESPCFNPNIAIHEILHTLGFNHSNNPQNIMYPITDCAQTIGQDIINTINELYSIPSYPDISFENVSAILHGRYLDTEVGIRNIGLKDSQDIEIQIYAGERSLKKINLEPLKIGHGMRITMNNIKIPRLNIQELRFVIRYDFEELEKENNEIILELTKEPLG